MRVVKLKLGLLGMMAGAVITAGVLGFNSNPALATTLQADAVETEYLKQPIDVNNGDQIIMMRLRDIELRSLLRAMADKAGFNILLDDSVEGTISVDFYNITINQALETVKDYADLVYMQDDKTLIVADKKSELASSINQQVSQMIPVKYINAKLVADLLNKTLFSSASAAGGDAGGGDAGDAAAGSDAGGKTATAEYRTNSVFIVGTDNDIRLAVDFIRTLDIPRESKTFRINHADAVGIAQLLQATVFNDGVAPFDATGGESSGLSSTGVTVMTESFEEGSGAASEVEGSSGGEGGGGEQQTYTLRTKTINQKDIKISPEGPLIVPDSRSNTLTIMGTLEQLALAEAVIPTLDQKLPQVAIESSLVEIKEGAFREMSLKWGQQSGQWATGFNNSKSNGISADGPAIQPLSSPTVITGYDADGAPITETLTNALGPIANIIGLPTVIGQKPINANGSALAFSTTPIDRSLNFLVQVNAMLSKSRAKLLANPTVMAVHNTEAVISITEEIVRRTTITRDATGFEQTQVEIGEAGIVLNILPKVTGDGFVTLRIRPSVSTVANEFRDEQGNITTLLKRKDFAVQEARVSNGQTLALGGLIDESSVKDTSKIPVLAEIPLLGALFRSNSKDMERTELLMLVTPTIVEDKIPVAHSSYSTEPIVNNNSTNSKGKWESGLPNAEVKQADAIEPETRENAYTADESIEKFGYNKSEKKDFNSKLMDKILGD